MFVEGDAVYSNNLDGVNEEWLLSKAGYNHLINNGSILSPIFYSQLQGGG